MADDQGAWVNRAFVWRASLGPVEAWADALRAEGWEIQPSDGSWHYDEDGQALIVSGRRWFMEPFRIPPR